MIEETFFPEATVPSPYFERHAIEMNLQIRKKDDSQYQADILVEGNPLRRPILLKDHDLRMISSDLQRTMGELAETIAVGDADTRKRLTQRLAYHGKRAFVRIFSDYDLRAFVHTVLSQPRLLVIEVVSDDFFVPWELLYDGEVRSYDISLTGFWGARHLISRVIRRSRYGAPFFSEIQFARRPTLGLLAYEKLTHVADKEIPYFEELAEQGKIGLYKLRSLKPVSQLEDLETWESEYEEFRRFWHKKLNLVHFACHAFRTPKDSTDPADLNIVLSEEYSISCKDLDVHKIQIESHPFIMLNACCTGSLDPLFTSGLVVAFWEAGARGILATECVVPDDFAADFAQRLYAHLLTGKELGDSLLETRRHFLLEHDNPLGLLYGMYASPSIRLVKAGG